jgi:hypothetical protein
MRVSYTGADPGGGERTRRAPHKIGKNMILLSLNSIIWSNE